MDLYCPKCGEPIANDELHEVEGKTYLQAAHAFQARGCAGIGYSCNPNGDKQRAAIADAMYYLLGDDLDGAASMFDDLRW